MEPQLSHVRGPDTPSLLEITIGEALAGAARTHGSRLAVADLGSGRRLTYAGLLAEADAVAAGLLALGLAPGDRVGVWSQNRIEWTVTQFAAARAGLVLVTINPAYRLSEVAYTLNKVGVTALVSADAFRTSAYADMIDELAPPGAGPGELPLLRHRILIGPNARPGWIRFDDLPALAGPAERAALAAGAQAIDPRAAVNIQFTSGTTGLPKGATLSHRNILNNGFFVGEALRLQPGEALCIPVPLYHCFGMVMGNLGCLTHGAAMVYPGEGFDAGRTLAAVEAERCAALYGVPTMFIAMLADPDFAARDLSSLRTGCMAGSPCPVEVMRRVVDEMGMREVTIAYGMTETSPVSFQSSPDDPLARRVSTVGRVQPHVECKVVDPEGATTPCGVPGELLTRGYSVMLGYWDDRERTAEAIDADGWMRTGDLAVIDEAGYGNIVGRIKDMVIRGGENIYPREIEEFLHGHPDIEDVAVVGVPDLRYGEALCAWIRPRPGSGLTEAAVLDHCKGRIAHYKVPAYVRLVDALPMTVTGKIQKFVIREAMIADLGLVAQQTA